MIFKGRLNSAENLIIIESRKRRYPESVKGIQKGYELTTIINETEITTKDIEKYISIDNNKDRVETSYRIQDCAHDKLLRLADQSNCSKVEVLRAILAERKMVISALQDIEITENNAISLIPFVNPGLRSEAGIKAAILYRVCPSIEIDSAIIVRNAYIKCYGENVPKCADTILNAWTPFLDFCRAKLIILKFKIPDKQKDLLLMILLHLDEIFADYVELRILFDKFFDLMYSFSNLMPAPEKFNGGNNRDGKGSWSLNKDYPSVFYKNLMEENSQIYEFKKTKEWLDSVMHQYKIHKMYQLEPPYPIQSYYGYDDSKLELLMNYIWQASRLIEERGVLIKS